MDDIRPPLILEIVADRGQRDTKTYVIEVTELNSEVRFDLWGHLEAAMASEATKMAVLDIMHIGSKVMEVIEHHMPISHSPCRRRS